MGDQRVYDTTALAGADLTGKEGYIVKVSADKTVVLAEADEGNAVLMEGGASGQEVRIRLLGKALVVLGATLTAGTKITSDANGKAVAVDVATDACIGFLFEGGDADEKREVIIIPMN